MGFQNLKAEMKRSGITQASVAELLDMSEKNVNLKINEHIPTTLDEANAIRKRFFPELEHSYLFESDGEDPATT